MIKMVCSCDGCGKTISVTEYRDQMIYGKSATREWSLKNVAICKECALKIDYFVIKFREGVI